MVVTITILFLVGPLLKEIGKAYTRLSTDKIILAAANAQGDVRESTYWSFSPDLEYVNGKKLSGTLEICCMFQVKFFEELCVRFA